VQHICVYCGSNRGARPEYAAAATRIGRLLGERGIGLHPLVEIVKNTAGCEGHVAVRVPRTKHHAHGRGRVGGLKV